MDGFSALAKNEITALSFPTTCCKRAYLSAVVRTGGTLVFSHSGMKVVLPAENDKLRAKISELFGEILDGVTVSEEGADTVISGENLGAALFALGIFTKTPEGETAVEDGILPALIKDECCKVNYIRGAFLGSGSLSLKAGYHLEFVLSGEKTAKDLCGLLSERGISGKITTRKDKFVVYLKGGEAVSDCLALMGATEAVLELNSEFALRQVRSAINRRSNCDIANISKTVNAAVRQNNDIKYIAQKAGLASLSDKLRVVAECRLEHPEESFSQIADILNLSKSTLKNRLNKLGEIAAELRQKEGKE